MNVNLDECLEALIRSFEESLDTIELSYPIDYFNANFLIKYKKRISIIDYRTFRIEDIE